MCYFLYLATPLTLSEVRSMLPSELTADALAYGEQQLLRRIYPDAQTALRILHGACSCDLFVPRDPVERTDEVHLRARARSLGFSRAQLLDVIDRHRRALELRRRPAGHWERALVGFVGEHARNAGPSLYFRHFAFRGLADRPPPASEPVVIPLAQVRDDPAGWLPDNQLTLVTR